jgi:hypothetical protein
VEGPGVGGGRNDPAQHEAGLDEKRQQRPGPANAIPHCSIVEQVSGDYQPLPSHLLLSRIRHGDAGARAADTSIGRVRPSCACRVCAWEERSR